MALQGNQNSFTPYTGAGAIGDGAFPAGLQPTQTKQLYQGNYLDFFSLGTGGQWAQQFLPDVYDKEVNIYGNRTMTAFLKMISAEMPTTSDQIIWTEQGRLHTRYVNVNVSETIMADATSANFIVSADQPGGTISDLAFRNGQTVMIQVQGTGTGNAANEANRGTGGTVLKGIVSAVGSVDGGGVASADQARSFTVHFYNAADVPGTAPAVNHTVLVYGSEYAKGTDGMTGTIYPEYNTYQNSPIIMKDHFAINGSDTSQIGWIEVTSENGAGGYLWYVKAEHENRLRWEDYMEMSMLESVQADSTSTAGTASAAGNVSGHSVADNQNGLRGTEGFFQSLERRGNIYSNLAGELFTNGDADSSSLGHNNGTLALNATFDYILKQLDKQGQIQENMLYVNRDLALAFDNFLATQNNVGANGFAGVSWGMFNNNSDMALNLGFSGFRRGSYDFYKTDWKYLNDWSLRGGFQDIEGVMLPSGTSTVYDEIAGGNVSRPFVHIRYRASEADNRKMKSWITGSVGGAYTNDVDEMRMHYLTERCIITQAANNFFLLKGA